MITITIISTIVSPQDAVWSLEAPLTPECPETNSLSAGC